MSGHGHVTPNPDGSRARCGGPGICDACTREAMLAGPLEPKVCEHGDHPAPDGRRFCSEACACCEHESIGINGCDGICGGEEER